MRMKHRYFQKIDIKDIEDIHLWILLSFRYGYIEPRQDIINKASKGPHTTDELFFALHQMEMIGFIERFGQPLGIKLSRSGAKYILGIK